MLGDRTMREILFRGQTRRRGERVYLNGNPVDSNWVYGGIFPQNNGGDYAIIYSYDPIEKHVVYADTVGQFTGITDKNGAKIFEGDIVKTKKYGKIVGHSCVNDYDIFSVKYEPAMFRLEHHNREFVFVDEGTDYEVVGNIYDNPELLK